MAMLASSGSSLDVGPASAPFVLRRGTAEDLSSVITLSRVVYGVDRSVASISWLYQQNPAGPCSFWLAESHTGQVVALRPVFPWRVSISGRDTLVAQAGDAMTHPDYRGRGLFSRLVQIAWEELRGRNVPFSFSFSNPGSLSVCRKIVVGDGPRAGTHVTLRFRRMVYPLSLEVVRGRLRVPGRVLSNLDGMYQASRRWRWLLPSHLSVFPVTRFDDEFDALWKRHAARFGVLTVRDSRYLNWRFIDAPSGRYRVIGLRSRGELAGYVTFEMDGRGCGSIADLFGLLEAEIVSALLASSLSAMLAAGCVKASLWTPEQSPLFALIRRFGFVARDDAFPMAVHVYRDGPDAAIALESREWLAWFGDRDVEAAPPAPTA
jgi:GNAT superfamily N-acetyltransferase